MSAGMSRPRRHPSLRAEAVGKRRHVHPRSDGQVAVGVLLPLQGVLPADAGHSSAQALRASWLSRRSSASSRSLYVGDVRGYDADGLAVVAVKNRFAVDDRIEILRPAGNL